MGVVNVEIDATELLDMMQKLRMVMTQEAYERRMAGIYRRVGRHVSASLKKQLPPEYYVKPKEISDAVKRVQMSGSGCVIPIKGTRRAIGGNHIKAYGSAPGWRIPKGGYQVTANIVKSGISTIPNKDGFKPFRNSKAKKLNGVAFHRVSNARYPIKKYVGIAVPQMPANRSREPVQADIIQYMANRIEHEFMREIGSI